MEQITANKVKISIPPAFSFLMEPRRYSVVYGGRGSGKSWSIVRILIALAASSKLRILCTREFQTSIGDSVYKLLVDQISALGLDSLFTILKTSIVSSCGSEFIFKGINHNIQEIKSLEGVDVVFCEEAQAMSEESWEVLIPTIRKENSRFFISFNVSEVTDPTYRRFVTSPPPSCVSKLINYDKNPHFPEVLRREMEYCKEVDYDAYEQVWLGKPYFASDALVFKNKFVVEDFETPSYGVNFLFGCDWGFSQDSTTLVRSFIVDNDLFIDYEAGGIGVEMEEIALLFDQVPLSREHLIIADAARPETISFVRRQGFGIQSCRKWAGCVQDGLAYMRKFRQIRIHSRCTNTINEFRHYSYKKDRVGNILPIINSNGFDHYIDSIRYSLEDSIQGTTDWLKAVG